MQRSNFGWQGEWLNLTHTGIPHQESASVAWWPLESVVPQAIALVCAVFLKLDCRNLLHAIWRSSLCVSVPIIEFGTRTSKIKGGRSLKDWGSFPKLIAKPNTMDRSLGEKRSSRQIWSLGILMLSFFSKELYLRESQVTKPPKSILKAFLGICLERSFVVFFELSFSAPLTSSQQKPYHILTTI